MSRFAAAELRARWRMIAGLAAGAFTFLLIMGLAYRSIGVQALGGSFRGGLPRSITAFSGSHSGDVLSPRGWMGLGFNHPMLMITTLTAAISIGAGAIAGEVDSGRAQLLFALPVARTRFLLCALVVWLVAELAVLAAGLSGALIGIAASSDLRHAALGGIVWAPLQLFPLALLVVSVSALASALSETRSRAIGMAIAVVVLGYLTNVVSGMIEEVDWLRWCTPFGYYDPSAAIGHGLRPWPAIALAATAAALLVAARAVLERRDLG